MVSALPLELLDHLVPDHPEQQVLLLHIMHGTAKTAVVLHAWGRPTERCSHQHTWLHVFCIAGRPIACNLLTVTDIRYQVSSSV